MKVNVFVTLKKGVLDPQGKAIKMSLGKLGYKEIKDVRLGKFIELDLEETEKNELNKRIEEMCKKLLANTVIEDFSYEVK